MKTDVIIIEASSPEEIDEILELRRLVFVNEQGVPEDIEIDQYEKTAQHFYLKVGGKMLASGRIRKTDEGVKFERVLTVKESRGLGYGRKLMNYIQQQVSELYPSVKMILNAQVASIGFYESLGWKVEGDTFMEANILHQKMVYKADQD